MKSGIYIIKHTSSGKRYIGSSVNLDQRWSIHKCSLRKGTHSNSKLQRAWNKYGEDAFEFSIIEYCDPIILIEREQHYVNLFIDTNLLYNIVLVIEPHGLGRVCQEETKRKIGEAQKGKLNHMYGKTHTEEAKRKISEASKVNNIKPYPSLISPTGTVYSSGIGLCKFCRDLGLEEKYNKGLNNLIHKRAKSYKGWKLNEGIN